MGGELPWAADHPVLEVLRARRASGSRPGRRRDPHRVALAVEGGGLRGVVSAGMLAALDDLDLKDAFDVIYACSSGAINAAYFTVGETWYPTSIYFEDLVSKEFLDFGRLLRKQSAMNLSYALDTVVGGRKPLDYKSVLASPVPLYVMVTDVDALTTRVITEFTSKDDLYDALRATMWLPLATRGTARFRGYDAIDGGALTAHPFMLAESDPSISHILSLSTRPVGTTTSTVSALSYLAGYRLNHLRKGLGARYIQAVRTYKHSRLRIEAQRLTPTSSPAILDLAPLENHTEVLRHEMRSWALLEGARSGYEVIYAAVEKRLRRPMLRLVIPDHDRADFPFPVTPADG
ncbi:patatin-like phospholipase family protein [Kribbella sp. NPDC026611]|uniref:patatin-like phospholipase family protein n=1 Tax=Kribbella sp. NPDC026611 TaxID=3154911 RepID=UPI0033DADC0E